MVYDMLGNKIKTIVNEKRSAGTYDVQWDGTNEMGVAVSSGVYFYKLSTDNHVATKKMMFIK
jgi:flagellar hook assembly protein FlgD